MFRFYKIIKDKILQCTKVLEGRKIYLIERRFLKTGQVSLLVCSNYKIISKTYDECVKFDDADLAYDYYSDCIKQKMIIEIGEVHDDIN